MIPGLPTGPLEGLGLSDAAARVLRYFLIRPNRTVHLRELQRALGLGGASVQRELQRLVNNLALHRRRNGRRVEYRAVLNSPVWQAVRILEATSADPTPLVRNAFADVRGIEAAFLFGSFARGTQRSDSDVDLFVVEAADVDRKKLFRQLGEVELVLGREVNAVRYTQLSLAERLGRKQHPGSSFVIEALTGPKRWVAGGASTIAPIAISAGIRMPDLMNVVEPAPSAKEKHA